MVTDRTIWRNTQMPRIKKAPFQTAIGIDQVVADIPGHDDFRNEVRGFLAYMASEKRSSPETIRAYGADLRHFATFMTDHFGALVSLNLLQDLTTKDFRSFMAALLSIMVVQIFRGMTNSGTKCEAFSHIWRPKSDRARRPSGPMGQTFGISRPS